MSIDVQWNPPIPRNSGAELLSDLDCTTDQNCAKYGSALCTATGRCICKRGFAFDSNQKNCRPGIVSISIMIVSKIQCLRIMRYNSIFVRTCLKSSEKNVTQRRTAQFQTQFVGALVGVAKEQGSLQQTIGNVLKVSSYLPQH